VLLTIGNGFTADSIQGNTQNAHKKRIRKTGKRTSLGHINLYSHTDRRIFKNVGINERK